MNLYEDTKDYIVKVFKDRDDWLSNRELGIGGSEASALIDKSKFKSNIDLWREKNKIIKRKDLSNNKNVDFGTKAENPIRKLFELDYRDKYEVQYVDNASLKSKKHEFMFYSPDGLLLDKNNGERGILEIKTSLIRGNYDDWKGKVPIEYYIQVLHGLLVTGFDFVKIRARLKFIKGDEINVIVNTYTIHRNEVEEDLIWLEQEEVTRWNKYYVNNVKPPLTIDI